jgi:hypothetical protein
MSGTSLAGLTVASCHPAGHGAGTRLTLERFATVPANEAVAGQLVAIVAGLK